MAGPFLVAGMRSVVAERPILVPAAGRLDPKGSRMAAGGPFPRPGRSDATLAVARVIRGAVEGARVRGVADDFLAEPVPDFRVVAAGFRAVPVADFWVFTAGFRVVPVADFRVFTAGFRAAARFRVVPVARLDASAPDVGRRARLDDAGAVRVGRNGDAAFRPGLAFEWTPPVLTGYRSTTRAQRRP